MRGWYDLYSLDKINDGEDVEGLKESMRCACMRLHTLYQGIFPLHACQTYVPRGCLNHSGWPGILEQVC